MQIVDAVAPVGELLGSHVAVALRVGCLGGFAVFTEGVVTPALSVPLKSSVFVSSIGACVEALLLITLSEVRHSLWHITLSSVLPASKE
jgi:hypothetical protein